MHQLQEWGELDYCSLLRFIVRLQTLPKYGAVEHSLSFAEITSGVINR